MSCTIWVGYVQHQRFNSYSLGKIPRPQFIFDIKPVWRDDR